MKKLLLFILLSQQTLAQQKTDIRILYPNPADSINIYNKPLSTNAMKQDLELFRNIREKANSGLYSYRTKKQIDSIYKWAFREIKKPLRTLDFYKIILQLSDFEGGCHNYTEPTSVFFNYLNSQRAFFPFALKYIAKKMIFNSMSDQIPVGARILSINGIPDSILMQSFYKYMPADGYTQTQKLSGSVNRSYGIR